MKFKKKRKSMLTTSAMRTLCEDLRQKNTKVILVANTSDESGEILLYNGCWSFPSPAQTAFSLLLPAVKSQILLDCLLYTSDAADE